MDFKEFLTKKLEEQELLKKFTFDERLALALSEVIIPLNGKVKYETGGEYSYPKHDDISKAVNESLCKYKINTHTNFIKYAMKEINKTKDNALIIEVTTQLTIYDGLSEYKREFEPSIGWAKAINKWGYLDDKAFQKAYTMSKKCGYIVNLNLSAGLPDADNLGVIENENGKNKNYVKDAIIDLAYDNYKANQTKQNNITSIKQQPKTQPKQEPLPKEVNQNRAERTSFNKEFQAFMKANPFFTPEVLTTRMIKYTGSRTYPDKDIIKQEFLYNLAILEAKIRAENNTHLVENDFIFQLMNSFEIPDELQGIEKTHLFISKALLYESDCLKDGLKFINEQKGDITLFTSGDEFMLINKNLISMLEESQVK